MFKQRIIPVTFLLLGFIMVPAAHAEWIPISNSLTPHGFERIAQRRGITVYKHARSAVIRLGAEGRIPYPPAEVERVLLDYRRQVGNIARLSEARVLKQGNRWLQVYQRLNLPVISDRDFTLHVTWGKSRQGLRWIRYRSSTAAGPAPRKGVVRVSDHRGSWQLKSMEGGRATWARFQVRIDLAGLLPRWLAKSGSGKEVPEVFFSLNKLLVQQRMRGRQQRQQRLQAARRSPCTSNCL